MPLIKLERSHTKPTELDFATEELLDRAGSLYGNQQASHLRELIAEKVEHLRRYDIARIDRVASILCWGRSGSLLLASYFDGHEDVLMLPEMKGAGVYDFFDRYQSLPLRTKLLAYPALGPYYPQLFEGDFAISSSHYYAAVEAILELYRDWPAEILESRRTFFVFVHIAYNLALGRSTSAPPLIAYQQHFWNDKIARYLVEDFPQAKFIHTVRDPLTTYNSLVRVVVEGWPSEPFSVYRHAMFGKLTSTDRPHPGMESRTRTVRLEDLHSDPVAMMQDLSGWLRLSYEPTLVTSTFNGTPYINQRNGNAWCGRNEEQTRRKAPDLAPKDQLALSAVFYENLVEWNYPHPRILESRMLRAILTVCLLPLPLKTEIYAAGAVWKHRILPSLRDRKFMRVMACVAGIALVRLKVMYIIASTVFQRCVHSPSLLPIHTGSLAQKVAAETGERKLEFVPGIHAATAPAGETARMVSSTER